MNNLVTAVFAREDHLQAALADLRALGIPPEAIRTIAVPPERPDAAAAELEIRDQPPLDAAGGAAVFGPTVAVGLASLGMAPGGPIGEVVGPGYPSGSLPTLEAAASPLDQAIDDLRHFGLPAPAAELYRRHLEGGAAVLAVRPEPAQLDQVTGLLSRHHAADLRVG
jgi:hypothetical protein